MTESLITQHIDLWTSAIEAKSTAGRGNKNKFDLYGIKKLRELVLELAIRGKLVPQNHEEPSIDFTRTEMVHERNALLNARKVKYKKVVSELDQNNYLHEIPKLWSWVNFSDVVFYQEGPGIRNWQFKSEGIKLLNVSNILPNGSLNFDNSDKYISIDECNEKYCHFIIEKGDLLFAGSGGSWGKSSWYEDPGYPVILNTSTIRLCFFYSQFSPNYLKYFLDSACFKRQMLSQLVGMQPNFGSTHLSQVKIPIPPLLEQHRIVAKVDELMALCDQLEQQTLTSIDAHTTLVETLLETLTNSANAAELEQNWARISEHFDTLFTTEQSIDALKQTILQLAVMGKLVRQDPTDEPASVLLEKIAAEKAQLIKDKKIKKEKPLPPISEDEKTFELPQGWEFARFGDLTTRLGSGSTPRGGANVYLNEGIPFLRSQNVWNDGLILDDIAYISNETHQKMENTKVTPGDILLNITGASLGRSTIFPLSVSEANVSQHVTVIRLIKLDMNRFIHLSDIPQLI